MIMNFQEFNSALKNHIYSLTFAKQLELAVVLCKKMFFDYHKFYEIHKWGNPDSLTYAINLLEKYHEIPVNADDINKLLLEINSVIPDTNDFGDVNGSYALNASAAVFETLQFITDKNPNHILNISTYYTDTLDFKIQETRDLSENQINNHPLIVEVRNFLINY